jgi:hypothetical protein
VTNWDGQSWDEAERAAEKMLYRAGTVIGATLVLVAVWLVRFSLSHRAGTVAPTAASKALR